jgi:thiol-disulfide isomerase/thioredoxin
MMSANPAMMMQAKPAVQAAELPDEGALPSLSGAVEWLNSPPLTAEALKGKVVLVDFWTYSCINCLREISYVRAWATKYKDQGLVVIGVHAPEFAFERNIANVKNAVATLKIGFPVAIDNNYAIWQAFNNEYWPAEYFVDAQGRIRHMQFGEGGYDVSERVIQQLLAEAGKTDVPGRLVSDNAAGAEDASDVQDDQSPETYIGYNRAESFVSPGGALQDTSHVYAPGMPQLNQWGLSGNWTVAGEQATLNEKGWRHCVSFPCTRSASCAGAGAEWRTDPVPHHDRWQTAR